MEQDNVESQTMRRRIVSFILTVAAVQPWLAFAAAGEPTFRRHDINPDSTYCACAAVDVNRDGRLDIVCGGWWYEAPTWKKHLLRDVPMIGGRYDDYSNLPLDVNGDGWIDLVSANYRSETLFWIENPGKRLGPWPAHVIAKPGPMETARLEDIDGDGQLDVLPNGMQFAAWWEVVRGPKALTPGPSPADGRGESSSDGPKASDAKGFRWVRHDLPIEAAGHGIGFGDVNGDGRGDVVTAKGWLEAPEDRRRGKWRWHPEFKLHPDASIPILVFDVDGDGDNDIVWGRGHNYGLFWLEQVRQQDGSRRWVQHEIDTRWAQAHSPLLADVDGDGRPELVAGKRYMGHDGRDPGELEPLCIYWYKFDRAAKTWQRHTISAGGRAGWGLDPKAVDLDGDGDVDLIAPGRSGLYWFENPGVENKKG